jgi:hypothetical protein
MDSIFGQLRRKNVVALLNVWRLHFDGTSLSSALIRDLKMK